MAYEEHLYGDEDDVTVTFDASTASEDELIEDLENDLFTVDEEEDT